MRNDNAISYSAYGHAATLTSAQTVIGFNGEYIDAKTNTYPLGKGYRMYSPTLMRFLSPDQLSPFAEGGINMYMYCNGDPVGKIDPSGRVPLLFKPFNRLYKGIKNRFFGRIPKNQRPTVTPTKNSNVNASPQGNNVINVTEIDPIIQKMARDERYWLNKSNLMDLAEFHGTDLTTVPPDIFENRLAIHNSRRQRITALTQEFQLGPLNPPTQGPSVDHSSLLAPAARSVRNPRVSDRRGQRNSSDSNDSLLGN